MQCKQSVLCNFAGDCFKEADLGVGRGTFGLPLLPRCHCLELGRGSRNSADHLAALLWKPFAKKMELRNRAMRALLGVELRGPSGPLPPPTALSRCRNLLLKKFLYLRSNVWSFLSMDHAFGVKSKNFLPSLSFQNYSPPPFFLDILNICVLHLSSWSILSQFLNRAWS